MKPHDPRRSLRIAPLIIGHSGKRFVSHWDGPADCPVWPIEELLSRRKFNRGMTKRIIAYNPHGIEEGSMIMGFFRKPTSWRRVKQREKLGRRAYFYRKKGGKIVTPDMF